jgi:hypothetical protein
VHASVFLAGFLAASSLPAWAQQPGAPASITVTGIITDATTGAPVIAAEVLLPDVRLLGSSNTEGRFRIANVPVGPQRVQVRRLGYRPLELTVVVSGSMPSPLEIRMEPDPVQLEGLRVAPNARGAMAGVVVDASSGAPIPWAYLTLTRGVTERVGRPLTAEENGTFSIRNVTAGEYMLKVERLGYFPQFLVFAHTVPADTLVVRLEPDLELM